MKIMRRRTKFAVNVATGAIFLGSFAAIAGVLTAPALVYNAFKETEEEKLVRRFEYCADDFGDRNGEASLSEKMNLVRISPQGEKLVEGLQLQERSEPYFSPAIMRHALESYRISNPSAHFFDS